MELVKYEKHDKVMACYGPDVTQHFYGSCVLHVVGSVILTEVMVCA